MLIITDMTKLEFNKIYIAYKGRLQPNIPAEDSVMLLLKRNQCLSAQQNKIGLNIWTLPCLDKVTLTRVRSITVNPLC